MACNIKCFFGFHKWGNWHKESGACVQQKTCGSCGETLRTEEHNWVEVDKTVLTSHSEVYYCGGPCCDLGAGGCHRDVTYETTIFYRCSVCGVTKQETKSDGPHREDGYGGVFGDEYTGEFPRSP